MNLDRIFDGFVLLTGLSHTEAVKWLPLCRIAMEEIDERLLENTDREKYSILLDNCASSGAFLKYAVIVSSGQNSESFSAGDIKISKNSSGEILNSARLLYSESLKSIITLCKDTGFLFKEMINDD